MNKYRIICGRFREYIFAKSKLEALREFTAIYGELDSVLVIEHVEE